MAKAAKKTGKPKAEEGSVADDFIPPEVFQAANAAQIWSHDDTGHDLTVEEQLFCRSFIVDRNPVAALRRLNYSDSPLRLKAIADRYMSNPEVQGCIDVLAKRMMDSLQITAERVNEKIASVAFMDPRQIMEFDHTGVHLLHSRYWTEAQATAIQSVEMGQNGIKIRMYNRMDALKLLAQQLSMVDDENEQQRRIAEAGADAALKKILDHAERKRQDRLPPANDEEVVEGTVSKPRSGP